MILNCCVLNPDSKSGLATSQVAQASRLCRAGVSPAWVLARTSLSGFRGRDARMTAGTAAPLSRRFWNWDK